ncbi:hypothetical protein [Bacillus subtilis]|uniref:hypothetical protein n=1 Tax=Bacillus subtilis TaxID=1423 RepID=UPI00107263F9|nr:hypothetical protein [Bacillus subtilis]MDP0484004.1 hypothetical protein [Bacillus subtilis]MEC4033283.1 hypothetical protein [Bacillus subtilis]URZ95531.1 hypothetical protein NCL52_10270 [Bacillus subtilis]
MSRKDLGMKNEIIKEHNVIRPKNDDQKWKGCFVFLEEYDEQLLKKGALVMRKNHKKNISFLKVENQTIWVRNTPHTGKEDYYVNQYTEVIEMRVKNIVSINTLELIPISIGFR